MGLPQYLSILTTNLSMETSFIIVFRSCHNIFFYFNIRHKAQSIPTHNPDTILLDWPYKCEPFYLLIPFAWSWTVLYWRYFYLNGWFWFHLSSTSKREKSRTTFFYLFPQLFIFFILPKHHWHMWFHNERVFCLSVKICVLLQLQTLVNFV